MSGLGWSDERFRRWEAKVSPFREKRPHIHVMLISHNVQALESLLQARERAGLAGKGELAAARRAAGEREAELRQAMREGEAKLRERIGRLDDDAQELRR